MIRILTVIMGAGVLFVSTSSADVSSVNVVGYTRGNMHPGENLISTAFDNAPNQISMLIQDAPEGTTLSLWDSSLNSYAQTSTYSGGAWSIDFTLPVGTGAMLNTPVAFTNIWAGSVLNGDGDIWNGSDPMEHPSAFSGDDGTYLMGLIVPVGPRIGEDVFLWTLGRAPNAGEKVTTLDAQTQSYTTTTYLGSGIWDNGIPELDLAESAFFTIPEPSSAGLFISATLMLITFRRKQNKMYRRT